MRGGCFVKTVIAIVLTALLCGSAQAADNGFLTPLYGQSLADAFLGKTMDGTYKKPREKSSTALFTESYYADGTTYYREGEITDEGTWTIHEDLICFEYKGELSGRKSCFNVFVSGTCLYAYHPRNVRNGKPISRNVWSVKTLTRGNISTCDDLVS